MSASEVIDIIKGLPEEAKREVVLYLQESGIRVAESSASGKRMSFEEAKNHVFANYGDLLKKLAQ